jgi:hypothetical protein
MSGWNELGKALAGDSDLAGIKGMQAGVQVANGRARLDEAMLGARKARDAEIGRQTLAQKAQDAGDGDLASMILQSRDPRELGGYRLDQQKLGWGNDAMSAARAPNADMNAVNRMLMVMSGKPADLTKIEDHTVLNPLQTPDAQHLTTDDLGQAMVGAEHALAGQRNASADASRALATKRGGGSTLTDDDLQSLMTQAGEMANSDGPGSHQAEADAWLQQQVAARGGTSAPKEVKPTALTSAEIKALFGTDTGSVDGTAYRGFLAYQNEKSKQDPRFRDARFASQQYAQDMHGITAGSATTATGAPSAPVEPGLGSRLMSALTGGSTSAAPAPAAPVNPADQHTASDAAQPKSKADYDALPSGALYVDPSDGNVRRKR